jgi:SAM-dependent methyltransferase
MTVESTRGVASGGGAGEPTSRNYTVSRKQAAEKCYLKAIAAEIEGSRFTDVEALASLRINHEDIMRYKARILGKGTAATGYASWTSFLLHDYGRRERCLSLGSGLGRVEKFLISLGFTSKFETIELSPYANKKAKVYDEGIKPCEGDLNFVELEPESYDFILCNGVLHHLINLEHVLGQINRALKPSGILLVSEYVGPTRWQFPEATLAWLRTMFPGIEFTRPPLWSIDGFESVRSGELLPLIEAQFGASCDRSVRYGGVYFPFLTCTAPSADTRVREVVDLDAGVSAKETLPPCYLMGVYRKSHLAPPKARAWSDAELGASLRPATPIVPSVVRSLKQSAVGVTLRVAKRHFHKAIAQLRSAWHPS